MATQRRFCRFNKKQDTPFGMAEVPEGGLCLSAFLVLSARGHPGHVLMGHLNPAAPWDHIGALDSSRVAAHGNGWMLPSCHLLLNEAPQAAARRIAREQLGRAGLPFAEPRVFSEVAAPRRFPGLADHWDLEFVFLGEWPDEAPPVSEAWTQLRFVDLAATPRSAIARSHEDVIEAAGLRIADR